jgi:hypothetical protein
MPDDAETGSGRINQPSARPTAARVALAVDTTTNVVCPVCGSVAVQEKCKIMCRSEQCRGRVVMNCSEF